MGINKILNAGKQHLKVKALGLPKGSIEMYEEWEKSGCNVGFGVYCFQAGENSKHKSDLQQELEFLEKMKSNNPKSFLSITGKVEWNERIKEIKKE